MNAILEIVKEYVVPHASLVLSVLTFVAGFIVYVLFDRRLKRQQLQLNDLELLTARSADVVAVFDPHVEKKVIYIRNNGKVAARDVTVCIDEDIRAMPRQFPFPMRMESGQSVGVSICRSIGGPASVSVKISWKDEARPTGVERLFDIPLFS